MATDGTETRMKRAVVAGIDIVVPVDVLDYEIVRGRDETDEEFEAIKAMYDKLFRAALTA